MEELNHGTDCTPDKHREDLIEIVHSYGAVNADDCADEILNSGFARPTPPTDSKDLAQFIKPYLADGLNAEAVAQAIIIYYLDPTPPTAPDHIPQAEKKVSPTEAKEALSEEAVKEVINKMFFEWDLEINPAHSLVLARCICAKFSPPRAKRMSVDDIVNIMDKFFDRSPKGQDIWAKGYAALKKTDIRKLAKALAI